MKPKDKPYKVADRDGMYAIVSRGGTIRSAWTTAPMAGSTRAMRRSIFERDLLPVWRSRLLTEITPGDLREHCLKIVDRGAPATAIHVRDIVKQIYGFAILHGEKNQEPCRRSRTRFHRNIQAQGPLSQPFRDSRPLPCHRSCRDTADHQARCEIFPPLDGPKERVAGCRLG
ncbi:phage integrase central domain-containing protein [Novosphingobium beihaiensis]